MSTSSRFEGKVSVTFIGTATAIIDIDGIRFLTDPFFSPAESFVQSRNVTLKVHENPALNLWDLPPIDAILLGHEDH
ncbi:zn-dependent hydrolases of the beta-lactamase [Colletotrichum asianum]|uniref:Zn-dependent hydrolases of the beta-lactamase n=1 Tax=Colletotrichum asianum TaxID=702518 RepID=A0A8H3W590_9PEZI|nr:zn-dependent hydrolases of the beta-lactamase [Colletotrichum asianum]